MNKEDRLMKDCRDLFHKLSLLNHSKMKDRFGDLKSSEVHCIEYIGNNKDLNVTKLAKAFYMTNGAISKLTKKLIKKGVIESYQKSDNKKEIYFRLTPQGKAFHEIHDALHQEFRARDQVVFDQITEETLDDMLRFLERYNMHLDVELEKQGNEMKSE